MAMAAQGLARATREMDFFVAPNEDNIERLKRALRSLFDDPNIEQIDPKELIGAFPAVEYTPPHGRHSMDILTRLGEAFANLRVACELSELAYGLRPWHFPPGVRKFRSVEEAWRAREEWERSQLRGREE